MIGNSGLQVRSLITHSPLPFSGWLVIACRIFFCIYQFTRKIELSGAKTHPSQRWRIWLPNPATRSLLSYQNRGCCALLELAGEFGQ
ncbi:MAG: hypothetical protein RMY28_025810 [Nostoc sp. ChiSLP01]|nr:hypothetical protein [Nostoc sp. CmiSLP01]MDZ8282306.1 hypothetical protein [Nostoc sp. ChiSLP01]